MKCCKARAKSLFVVKLIYMRIKVGMKYWLHNDKQIKMHELKMQTLIADTWLIHKERLWNNRY